MESLNSVDVVTFGCRLNAHESDQARAQALADGLSDAVIFNTCAVTGEAVRQARQAIRKARRARPDAKLVVTGCAAQIDPAAFAAMPEVDLVLGNDRKAASGAYADFSAKVRVGDIMASRALARALPTARQPAERARAYVEVQNGCDHRCTFCIIPFGRGNSRSVDAAEVVRRVRTLTDQGFNEVVLTGVDLTAWGQDFPSSNNERPMLGDLVARILSDVPELPRLRLSSIDAAEIDPALLRCLAEEPRLMPHLHLSLQHGDDMILKRMKRRHSRADALRLIDRVRSVRPETAFGADLIAGFPTETDAMFENTLSLVEEAGLAYVHAFPFSPRPGTPAARMPQLDRGTIKARAERLRQAGDAALTRHLDRQIGRTVSAIVERAGRARAEDFTEVVFDGEAPAGEIIRLKITSHDGERAFCSPHPQSGEGGAARMRRDGGGAGQAQPQPHAPSTAKPVLGLGSAETRGRSPSPVSRGRIRST
jgi:threonylcarbamoyladenosine tRNA methylthiotransferase MtaB